MKLQNSSRAEKVNKHKKSSNIEHTFRLLCKPGRKGNIFCYYLETTKNMEKTKLDDDTRIYKK